MLTWQGPADIKKFCESPFPNYDKVKIISLQVEQAALIEQKTRIKEIEAEIEALETKDASFVDQLKLIEVQQRFLSSVADFSQERPKQLQTGTRIEKLEIYPQLYDQRDEDWLRRKRRIEKEGLCWVGKFKN